MGKKEVREKLLDMRRGLTSKFIEEASEQILVQLMTDERVANAENMLVYSHFDNEVKTGSLTGWLLYRGKQVYLPLIHEKKMHAASIRNAVLEMSRFGVAQPSMDTAELIQPQQLDLIIVPGVAFDRKKNRLGFGMGYYDTFLQDTQAYRMALAYDFQVLESLPAEVHDQKMDCIITPDFTVQ